jgi:hypothetical protein
MKSFLKYLPKTKELLDKAKNKPTIEDRVEALELAMLEQITGGLEDV